MRWSVIICLLLAIALMTSARPRRKRTLGYIKSFITNKLFRTHTVIVAQPIHSNNDTYQLFRIPGFDDILLKVSKSNKIVTTEKENGKETEKDKERKPEKQTHHDPVIVKPEIAIIGSYLGTTTQNETLIAIEMVKSLIQSGILSGRRDNWIQETVPIIPQPLEYIETETVPVPMNGFVEDENNIYVPPTEGNEDQVSAVNPIPIYRVEYPPLFVASEVEARPAQTKYSYKQKGSEADMTYESFNNKDVIVTRTDKEPPLPQFIKVRIAEAATMGANPYLIREPVHTSVPIPYMYSNIVAPENIQVPQMIPYLTQRVGMTGPIRKFGVFSESEYSGNADGGPILIDKNPVLFSKPIEIIPDPFINVQQTIRCKDKNVGKTCPYEKMELKTNKKSNKNTVESVKIKQDNVAKSNEAKNVPDVTNNGHSTNDKQNKPNDSSKVLTQLLKNNSVNGQIVSQYTYKQINHNSNDNYTVVKVGESKLFTDSDVETIHGTIPKDFVFIPPNKEDTPLHIALSSHNHANSEIDKQNNDKNAFTSRLKERKPHEANNNENDLKHNPIIVSETVAKNNLTTDAASDAKTNETIDFENRKRGDIPGSDF